jgi:uncharacterized protein YndB with AHSA1/START domain
MESISIERSIWINAPRERVWQALTDPAQVEQWFAPGTAFKSSGSEAGAKLYIEDPDTGAELYTQILEVVEPPNRLVLRSESEPHFRTGYVLKEENGGTRVLFTFSGYEGLPEAERKPMMQENDAGFELMLGNIKAFIEGTPLPNPQGF